MDNRQNKAAAWWQAGGWILLALGLIDLLAWHLGSQLAVLEVLHLGSRDRAWTLVILAGVAMGTAALLRQILRLHEELAALHKREGAGARSGADPSDAS